MGNGMSGKSDTNYRPITVQILADSVFLSALASKLTGIPAIALSPARQVAAPTDLNLDLASIKEALTTMTAVITTAHSAGRFAELFLAGIRDRSQPVLIKIAAERIEFSDDTDLITARPLLRAALGLTPGG
jgi:hypothetical protein